MNESRRRDSTAICYAILKAATGGQRKTRIMYQARLNLNQLNARIESLVACDLMVRQPVGHYFSTTERGIAFTRMYEKARETEDILLEQKNALESFLTPRVKRSVEVAA